MLERKKNIRLYAVILSLKREMSRCFLKVVEVLFFRFSVELLLYFIFKSICFFVVTVCDNTFSWKAPNAMWELFLITTMQVSKQVSK